jgi:hypothetical protein
VELLTRGGVALANHTGISKLAEGVEKVRAHEGGAENPEVGGPPRYILAGCVARDGPRPSVPVAAIGGRRGGSLPSKEIITPEVSFLARLIVGIGVGNGNRVRHEGLRERARSCCLIR